MKINAAVHVFLAVRPGAHPKGRNTCSRHLPHLTERHESEKSIDQAQLHTDSSTNGRAGSSRCNGDGSHQFQSPSSRMVDGTSSARTTVASRNTASAIPKPSALIKTTSAVTNDPATTTTSSAAEVMIRPDRCNPTATACELFPLRSHSSRMRERRKTS